MKALLKQVRISAKKVNLVAGMVRRKSVREALDTLKFTPKKAARLLYKVVASAAANAENNFQQNRDDLHIQEILVNEGPSYKRSIPCSRGRSHPIIKRTSHIVVKVSSTDQKPAQPKKTSDIETKSVSPKKKSRAKVASKKSQ